VNFTVVSFFFLAMLSTLDSFLPYAGPSDHIMLGLPKFRFPRGPEFNTILVSIDLAKTLSMFLVNIADIAVGTVTRLQAGRQGNLGLILSKGRHCRSQWPRCLRHEMSPTA
jgi:hypothetical protein